jgi:hypothetical protein
MWTAPDVTAVDEPFVRNERVMLEGLLDVNRATLLVRCAGRTGGDLARRSLPPSTMSLLGLVRHVTDVERQWLRRRFAGEAIPRRRATDANPDAAFDEADGERAELDHARLLVEQQATRGAVANLPLHCS